MNPAHVCPYVNIPIQATPCKTCCRGLYHPHNLCKEKIVNPAASSKPSAALNPSLN